MSFKGKNAVVTGGSSGIGFQVVKELLAKGAEKIAIIDLKDNLEEIVKLRADYPAQSIIPLKMDVANKKGVEASYEEIIKIMGKLDIIINVAGIFNDKDVQRTLLVNLGGMIHSTLSALKYMNKGNGGNGGIICNMASVVGLDHTFLVPIYAATKAGIISFTRCLSHRECYQRTGVKLISVCPGATITDMFTNFSEKMLFPELANESYQVLGRLHKQSASDVARCIMNALEKEENGAVYIIEGKRLFPMEMKRYWRGIEKELND
uniref:Alcohol dehydrogenase n=1 Tax=Glossina brevipalpis TaxID=37001 RepID=A0A1A9X0K5_9MUSC